ncbi:ATP-dependent Clp protease proteolytic subunit [Silvanigrella paludirubra]|jgi:ATP-dependent Clp protease protease subunit|uniref:ATP-dependent Clp protease proteolytic subunit n=1 Tax=Silvanigrella paludirubra TaxID=2499159 RepID=A0A6N6VVX7_9BACT|nr:ATP-dependent Clp protease proteolytic subunit [Silvanigrella paludirubra]KAB8040750.1 ATP-dependent Clp protease proteolytic subunit [Silvanigrella paludirubra]
MPNHDDLTSIFEATTQKKLFDQRIVILSEAIHAASAKRVIEQLFALEAADATKEIWLFLNSPGGEVNSGFGIYDTIRFVRPEVKIIVTGLAASAATVVLLAAESKHRYSMPNSRLLIHQPLIGGSIQGQASDIEIHAKEILKTREKIAELYTKETKQPIERVRKDIERDYWMTAQEALEYGLITKVISSWNEVR